MAEHEGETEFSETGPPVRRWIPDAEPKATCVLVHGMAEHSGRYGHVAERLARAGYATYGFDLRGHGRARGFPGQVSDAEDWLEDLAQVLAHVQEEQARPVFVIAHSMGTLVTLAYLGERGEQEVAGVVLSGTATVVGQLLVEALSRQDGTGIPPEALTRDPEHVRAYAEDPLVLGGRVPPEMWMAAAAINQRAVEAAPKVGVPVLLVHGSADGICDTSGATDVHARIASTDKTLKVYEGLYHEVFNELERDEVLSDVVTWLDAHS